MIQHKLKQMSGVHDADTNRLILATRCQCQSKYFSVAKIAELLRSAQRRSRVIIQNQEMIVEKEMALTENR